MPDYSKNIPLEEEIAQVNETARSARHAQVFYLTIVAFGYLLLLSITHRHLMLNADVRMPFINLEVPLNLFFIVAPPLLLLVHFAIMQQHVILSGKMEKLCNRPDFNPEKHEALLSSYHFVQHRLGRNRGLLFRLFLGLRYGLVFYGLPALLFLLFLWRFLPYHDEAISWWHRFCLWVAVIQMWVFAYYLRNPHGPITGSLLKKLFSKAYFHQFMPGCRAALGLVAGIMIIFISFFLNIPHGGVEGKGWLEKNLLQTSLCFPVMIDENTTRKACWLTAVLTEWSPVFFRRNLVVRDQDLVHDVKWEPEKEASLRLRGRDFRYADFSNSDMHRADLQGADLRGANLSGVNLEKARISHANMERIDLSYAKLINADLRFAKLSRSTLLGINLENSILFSAELNFSNFTKGKDFFTYANLKNVNLRDSELYGAFLDGAALQGADMRGAILDGSILSGADIQGANLSSASLIGADLSSAGLQGSNLSFANLLGADLTYADMQGANLRKANLKRSLLNKTDIRKTWLMEAYVWETTKPESYSYEYTKWNINVTEMITENEISCIKWLLTNKFIVNKKIRERLMHITKTRKNLPWKNSDDYIFWRDYAEKPNKKDKIIVLIKFGHTQAEYLCALIKNRSIKKSLWNFIYEPYIGIGSFPDDPLDATKEASSWDEESQYSAAYAWKLCPDLIEDEQIRRIFKTFSQKLLKNKNNN